MLSTCRVPGTCYWACSTYAPMASSRDEAASSSGSPSTSRSPASHGHAAGTATLARTFSRPGRVKCAARNPFALLRSTCSSSPPDHFLPPRQPALCATFARQARPSATAATADSRGPRRDSGELSCPRTLLLASPPHPLRPSVRHDLGPHAFLPRRRPSSLDSRHSTPSTAA